MKNLGIVLFMGLVFLQFSCKKTEYVQSSPQILITVMDDNVVVIGGATVTLYNTKEDWSQKANAVQSLQTDSKGQALFEDLQEQKYYFFVEKGDKNNLADIAATAEPLKMGQLSQLLVKIMENPL